MAIITQSSFSRDLKPVVHQWFGMAHPGYGEQHKSIFEILTSKDAFETDALYVGLGLGAIVDEGAAPLYDSMHQGSKYDYTHVQYGKGFMVTEIALEDGKALKLAEEGAKDLKKSMLHVKEIVAANVLNNAFDSAVTFHDGVELCSTAHVLQHAANLSNELASPSNLSEASLEQALIDIAAFVDDRGLRIGIKVKQLIIPPALVFEAERLLITNLRPGTAENDINAVRSRGDIPGGYITNNFLTDTNAWFLQTNAEKGLRLYERRMPRIDSDNDVDTSNAKFKVSMRFSVGATDSGRCIFGSPGV
jgi:hypothetical protein